jgi:formate dehydrogenase (coenzyme F420) beta subunit
MVNVEELRAHVAKLLEEGKVKGVVGYRRGTAGMLAEPCVVDKPDDAASLIWDPGCVNNLALYLVKDRKAQAASKTPDNRPLAVMAKGCDSRAVAVLLQENYFKREDVVVIGVSCEGSGVVDARKLSAQLKGRTASKIEFDGADGFKVTIGKTESVVPAKDIMADRCLECRAPSPALHDTLFGDAVESRDYAEPFAAAKAADEASEEERWATWEHHFDRCLRCYACRSVCPMCYCPECVVDSTSIVITPETSAEDKANRVRWCERSASSGESAMYHLTRAIHLAGRCVDCGECERVCPVNIPLRLLNTKLEMEAFEMFEYQAGRDPARPSLLSSFRDEDPNAFVR